MDRYISRSWQSWAAASRLLSDFGTCTQGDSYNSYNAIKAQMKPAQNWCSNDAMYALGRADAATFS